MPTDPSASPTECVVNLAEHPSATQTVVDSDPNAPTISLARSGETISAENGHSLRFLPKASSGVSSTQLPLVNDAMLETLESDSSSQPPVLPEQRNSTPTQFAQASQVPVVSSKLQGTYINIFCCKIYIHKQSY